MTPEQYRELEERFSEALDLSRDGRALLLEKLCSEDSVVGEALRALLAADEEGQGFIEAPAVEAAPDSLLRRLVRGSEPDPSEPGTGPGLAAKAARSRESDPVEQREFGPYRLLAQLGRGGMGVVYRAQHRETGQFAALKTVVGAREAGLSSLRREIRALARLRHPGIVRILDEGVERGLPWYAMELLEGTPLNRYRSAPAASERPSPDGPLDSTTPITAPISHPEPQSWWTQALNDDAGTGLVEPHRNDSTVPAEPQLAASALPLAGGGRLAGVLRLVRRLCSPLAYLHGEGLVHRDLKPANLVVQQGDWPVLVDFGLMTQFSVSELSREVLDVSALSAGTVTYIAPEQARGEFVDARADLYALGCILYHLVCGRPPFAGRDVTRVIAQHFYEPPKPPSHMADGVPAGLDAVILKLLEKEPRNRFGYATDVAAALEAIAGSDEEGWSDEPSARSYLYRPGFGGRKDELELLLQQMDKLLVGPGGSPREAGSPLVLLGGESGIGKTRLAMEFAREAATAKVRVLVGECVQTTSADQRAADSEPEEGFALAARGSKLAASLLHPLRRPLQQIADLCREKGIAETERLLGPRGKVLAVYEPALEGLPGQELHPVPAELPPSAALLRLYSSLTETFAALAERNPLLLVLDDLQWADELTLGFLEHFLHSETSRAKKVLLLGTYRSEELSGVLGKLCTSPAVAKLELRRFDEATVASMIANMLALSAPPQGFSRHLARQSEGNAFFVAEYLRAAVGEGLLWRDHQGVWKVADSAGSPTSEAAERDARSEIATRDSAAPDTIYEQLPLPASLRELVGRRLEALSAPAEQMAQAAAVLGREVDEALLAPMTPLEGASAMDAVGELVARQVLEQAASGRLRFVHDKIREVAYARIQLEARPALHRTAAVAMDAQPVAERSRHLAALGYHWEQAGEARQARGAYLTGAVAAYSDAALSEAERLYLAYLRLVTEPDEESAQALLNFGFDVLHLQGRNDEAREVFQRALEIAQALALVKIEAGCLRNLSIIHWLTRSLADAVTPLERSLEIQRKLGDSLAICGTLNLLATIKSQQNARDEAYALYHEALSLAIQSGSARVEGSTLGNLAILERSRGHWNEARAHYERALIVTRESGDKRIEAATLGNFGNLLQVTGQTREAEAAYRRSLELQQAIGDRRNEAYSTYNLASVFEAQGRANEARPLYERSLKFGREAGELRLCFTNLSGLYSLAMRDGAFEEAQRFLEEALSHARSLGDHDSGAQGLLYLARLKRMGQGDLAAAESLAQEAEDLTPEGEIELPILVCCERAHGLLAAGRSAEDTLRRARELGRGLPPEGDLARLLARTEQAQAAFAAGEQHRLFRGELLEDQPEGLRRRLGRFLPPTAVPEVTSASLAENSKDLHDA